MQAFLAAVERAKKAGIFVITTSTYQYYEWLSQENDFAGLGKVDYAGDPDKLSTALETADTLTVNIQSENTLGNSDEGAQYTFQHVINPVRLIESFQK